MICSVIPGVKLRFKIESSSNYPTFSLLSQNKAYFYLREIFYVNLTLNLWPPNDSSDYCMTKLENSTNISLYFRQNNSLYVNVTQVPSVKNVVSSQIPSDHGTNWPLRTFRTYLFLQKPINPTDCCSLWPIRPWYNQTWCLNILLKYNCCHINITNCYVFFQILRMFISLLYFFFYLVFSLLCYKN